MKRALFVAAYLAFALLFVEVALQAFYYATAGQFLFSRVGRPIWAPEPHAGFGVKPNLAIEHNTNEFRTQVFTNSRGFRVSERREEYAYETSPGTTRVMLLGPSFAFGWGVNHEQTLAAQLERRLEQAGFGGTGNVEVINAGVPSLGPFEQLEWYRQEGVKYQPDLVVQLVYGSLEVAPLQTGTVRVDDEGNLLASNLSTFQTVTRIAKKSAIVFYGWVIKTQLETRFGAGAAETAVSGAGRELKAARRFDASDPALATAFGFYEDLRRTVEGGGARLLIVYFPLSYCVHREDIARWKHLGVKDIDAQIAFDADFCAHLRREGLDCLDATPDLVAASARGGARLYYWVDIHWTPEGNRVTAEAVARHLLAPPGPAATARSADSAARP